MHCDDLCHLKTVEEDMFSRDRKGTAREGRREGETDEDREKYGGTRSKIEKLSIFA